MLGYYSEIAFCITIMLASLIFVALRLYIRYFLNLRRSISAPYIIGDVLMVVSWILSASYGFAHVYFRHHQHSNRETAKTSSEVSNAISILSMKARAFQSVAATIAIYSIKASFLCIFYCTPVHVNVKLRRALAAATCFTVVAFLIAFLFIFRCGPISSYWKLGPGNCFANRATCAIVLFCSLHLATDFVLMGVGYVLVSHSRSLTGRVWYGVIFIFFLIFLTAVINTVRMVVALLLLNLKSRADGRSNEFTEAMVLLCLAELNVGLIALTLPSFRVLWRRICKSPVGLDQRKSKDVAGFNENGIEMFEDIGGILGGNTEWIATKSQETLRPQ